MYWGVIPHQAEITQGTVNGTIVKAIETAKGSAMSRLAI